MILMCVELVCEGNFLLILENFLLVGEDFLQVELGSAWLVVVLNLVAGPWGLVHLFVCQPRRAAGRSAPERSLCHYCHCVFYHHCVHCGKT